MAEPTDHLAQVLGPVVVKQSVPLADSSQRGRVETTPTQLVGNSHRSEEHTSELQSLVNLVCRLLLEKKKTSNIHQSPAPAALMLCIYAPHRD